MSCWIELRNLMPSVNIKKIADDIARVCRTGVSAGRNLRWTVRLIC